jgi:simple sugar transport system ATP-binding protein
LADNLSVLDNVLIGTEEVVAAILAPARGTQRRLAGGSKQFGLTVDADARIGDLSVGERQRVEILKALYRGAQILILDEPTAVLTPQESEALFADAQDAGRRRLSIIFISHKLDEVLATSRRVAVLRQASWSQSATRPPAKTELAELMVGYRVDAPVRACT